MNKLDLLKLARRNLWRRKVRTILTVLGVLIGTTSIIVMLSLGIGLNESQLKSMESWGSLTMIRVQQGMLFDNEGQPMGEAKRLNDEAIAEIKAIEGVVAVSPAYEIGGEALLGRKQGGLQIIGIDSEIMNQLEFEVDHGRLLEEGDRNVIVMGRQVINQFQDESERRMMERAMREGGGMIYEGPRSRSQKDPSEMMEQRLSMTVRNNSNEKKKLFNFTVVGVLKGEFTEHSYQAYAPIDDIKRMREFMMGGAQKAGNGSVPREMLMKSGSMKRGAVRSNSSSRGAEDYSFILVRTEKVELTRQVSQVLKERGYNCWSIADQLEGIEKTSRTVQAILGGIGAITLLVAALGITNTMIMSIYERTKEIGIMKVIGAAFSDIYTLFLVEAGMIGFIGGLFGIGLSYGISRIINHVVRRLMQGNMPTEEVMNISVISPWLVLFALLFSVLIGVVAGLYPAYRAVRLSPINAIRNE